jgi:hypothetical protein
LSSSSPPSSIILGLGSINEQDMLYLVFWAWLISFNMMIHPFTCKRPNFTFLCGWAIFHGAYIV